jgi:hypothetical protein
MKRRTRPQPTESLWAGSCTAKPRPASSCEICTLLGYYAAYSGNFLLTFQDNLLVPSSTVKESDRENRAWVKWTEIIFFFWGALSIVQFFQEAQCCGSPLCSRFREQKKKHLTWWTPWLSYSYSLGSIGTVRYAPESRSSPRVRTGKWLMKN